MNIYDFDKTLYVRDSSIDFFRFCAWRYPPALRVLPASIFSLLGVPLGISDLTRVKEIFYRFLTVLPDTEAEAEAFWDENFAGIKKWYLDQRRDDDIVISASPEFLLRVPCKRLGIRLIATCVDPETGRIRGKNCRGREKVLRLLEQFPDAVVDRFYSDSKSDTPLAELAGEAFLVKGSRLIHWDKPNTR